MLSQNKQRTRVLAAFARPELFNVSGLKKQCDRSLALFGADYQRSVGSYLELQQVRAGSACRQEDIPLWMKFKTKTTEKSLM